MENEIDFYKSFIGDGCVNYEKYENSSMKVLFLLKEPGSNRDGNTYVGNKPIEEQLENHWFKNLVYDADKNKKNNIRYYKKFKIMADILGVDLEETAMVNINKRGGFSTGTDDNVLYEYTKQFGELVKEEIKILAPNIIVACIGKGKTAKVFLELGDANWHYINVQQKNKLNLYTKIWNIENKKIKVCAINHPGEFALGYEKYKNVFKQVYKMVKTISWCFGINPKALQYLMGHTDIGVTMNTYTHVGYEDAKAEIERLSSDSKTTHVVKFG